MLTPYYVLVIDKCSVGLYYLEEKISCLNELHELMNFHQSKHIETDKKLGDK